jgi:hypothetical protein
MCAISLRLLTALLGVLGSAEATPGLNEALSVANGLVSASQASGQTAHALLTDNFDLELTDEVKRCVCGIVPTPCCFLECGNKKLAPTRLFEFEKLFYDVILSRMRAINHQYCCSCFCNGNII